ncbi:MAG: hypothetical protein JWO60_622 [Frankiales bacterium]|nr:hypothetical protein [Frankiales bacterium]
MTVLDTLRGATRPGRTAAETDEAQAPVPVRLVTGRQSVVLGLILTVLLAGTLALLFGPARGMRDDIGETQTDLASSEKAIYGTLGTGRESLAVVRTQLGAAEKSLVIQQQGLEVAQAAEQDTTAIREQTEAALETVREVTRALGPLDQLDDKAEAVVRSVEEGVRLAQAALRVAEQTLATGRQALAVARETLTTLKESEQVQRELLDVARKTLQETREINRKIPGAPVFPTTAP